MVREICKDEAFLAQKAEPATADDLGVAQDLLDTLIAHKDGCVGLAANMIGVNKRIIAFENGGKYMIMLNPVIIKKLRGGLPVACRHAQDRTLALHKSSVAERKVPDSGQDLHELYRRDNSARDRPLRGDHNIKQRKTPHLTGEEFLRSCAEI